MTNWSKRWHFLSWSTLELLLAFFRLENTHIVFWDTLYSFNMTNWGQSHNLIYNCNDINDWNHLPKDLREHHCVLKSILWGYMTDFSSLSFFIVFCVFSPLHFTSVRPSDLVCVLNYGVTKCDSVKQDSKCETKGIK